jgi:prephenate dehydrogenase
MTIGIIGLGLIGGSFAKAFAEDSARRLLGWDRDAGTREAALAAGVLHGLLTPEQYGACDLLLVALPPQATLTVLEDVAPHVRRDALVVDCCGVKRTICAAGFALARRHGFTFIGGHPMAGRECSGFASSLPTLFRKASMLLVPDDRADAARRQAAESIFLAIGFGRVIFTTAEHHDRVIALTSQLAHVVSNAYVQSPLALEHRGYSAGSFADLTRVARLDEELWSALFIANRDNLLRELDMLTDTLALYREALEQSDTDTLRRLLKQGRECKEAL